MPRSTRQMMSPEALQLVAARFKVLSDPMRLRILQTLESGETSVSALTEAVDAAIALGEADERPGHVVVDEIVALVVKIDAFRGGVRTEQHP